MSKGNEESQYRHSYIGIQEEKLTGREVKYVDAALEKGKIRINAGGIAVPITKTMAGIRAKLGELHAFGLLKEKLIEKELQEHASQSTDLPSMSQSVGLQEVSLIEPATPQIAISEADDSWTEELDQQNSAAGELLEISDMDAEALASKETVGEIAPPLKGYYIEGLKLPLPEGFRKFKPDNKELGGLAEEIPLINAYEPEEGDVHLQYPIGRRVESFALPSSFQIVACDNHDPDLEDDEQEGYFIAQPTEKVPLINYNIDVIEGDAVDYVIRKRSEMPKYEVSPPSGKEQKYWSQVLLLPLKLREMCESQPELIVPLVATYVAQNFGYACHDRLGEFIKDNADDLPLIVDELKVGHCDLLSWISCAYLRGLGQAAFVTSDKVSSPEGTGFMKRYGHARVVVIDEDGREKFFDPAAHVELARGFSKKVLQDSIVDKLEKAYLEAETEEAKRNVLRKFLQELKQRKGPEDLQGSMNFRSYGNSIEPLAINLKESPRRISDRETVVKFSLNEEYGPEDIVDIWRNNELRVDNAWEISVDTWESRVCFLRALDFFRKHRLPAYFVHIAGLVDFVTDPVLNDENRLPMEWTFLSRIAAVYPAIHQRFVTCHSIEDLVRTFGVRLPNGDLIHTLEKQPQFLIKDILVNNELLYRQPICSTTLPEKFGFSTAVTQLIKNKRLDLSNLFDSFAKLREVPGYEEGFEADVQSSDYFDFIELVIFMHLVTDALVKPKLLEHLKSTLGLGNEYFDRFAEKFLNTGNCTGRGLLKNLAQLPLSQEKRQQAMIYFNRVRINPADRRRAQRGFDQLIRQIDSKPRTGRRQFQPEGWRLEKYIPGVHQAKDICWVKSAQNPFEPIVKVYEPECSYSQPLYIYIDLNKNNYFLSENVRCSSMECLIENLMSLVGKGRDVYITTNYITDYVPLKKCKIPIKDIVLRLYPDAFCLDQESRDTANNYSIHCRGKIPENLIFISDCLVDVNAVAWKYGKECNLVSTTFRDADLDAYYVAREEWVKSGDK